MDIFQMGRRGGGKGATKISHSLVTFPYDCLKIRYIAFVNSSASACLGIHVFGVFLLAAPWYNFLGEHFLKGSSQLWRKKFIQKD